MAIEEHTYELTGRARALRCAVILFMSLAPGCDQAAADVDLDGDGALDRIRVVRRSQEPPALAINDHVYVVAGVRFDGNYEVVDIDLRDRLREIAVREPGESGEILTTFFQYRHSRLDRVGQVADLAPPVVDGKGVVYGRSQGALLHTWHYRIAYRLDSAHRLQSVEQPLYEMRTRCALKQALPLQASPTDTTIVATPVRGDTVEIVASDNQRWCIARTEDSLWGWFDVADYDRIVRLDQRATEVFDGLNRAP